MTPPFVDIHCHLLPGVDDGATDLAVSLAMAEMAAADGVGVVVATPHQAGAFCHNRGPVVRQRVVELQLAIDAAGIPLSVLPGGDVRIEGDLVAQLAAGDVLTLADRGRHVLLELPHELYFPLAGLLEALRRRGVVGVLSHPERNAGLLAQPHLVGELVDQGCLMQVTAGSFTGGFGPHCQTLAERLLAEGLIHLIATDGHGVRSRRPLMRRAFDRVAMLTDAETALDLCCRHPALVAVGEDVPSGRRRVATPPPMRGWRRYFSRTKAA